MLTPSDTPAQPAPYRLKFLPEALAEWNALDGSVKEVLRKALKKRLVPCYQKPVVRGASAAIQCATAARMGSGDTEEGS